jgi:hypothetical protein
MGVTAGCILRAPKEITSGEPAAGRPRGHAGGLAEQAQYRGLVLGESTVGAREGEDRLVGTADRTLGHGLRIDVEAVEEVGHLVEASDHEPGVCV